MSDPAWQAANVLSASPPGGIGNQAGAAAARLVLGMTLRRLRAAAGLSLTSAAEATGLAATRIGELEQGQGSMALRDVAGLYTTYRVDDLADRATLLGLARQANIPQWWHRYRELIPGWFECYLGLEQAASLIRSYTAQILPALLQTPDYARAVIALTHGDAARPELRQRVELRMSRQRILHGPHPPRLWAVIDEAALRRPAGTRTIMRAQLRHLISACDQPNITICVLPFRLGGHAATGGPVAIVRLPHRQLPDIAYLEQLASGLYFRTPAQVDYYRHILNQLAIQAEPAGPPQQLLAQILHDT